MFIGGDNSFDSDSGDRLEFGGTHSSSFSHNDDEKELVAEGSYRRTANFV